MLFRIKHYLLLIFFPTIILFFIFSCANSEKTSSTRFKITGEFPKIPDSTIVEVTNLLSGKKDSIYILNGKFQLEGSIEYPTTFQALAINKKNRRPYFYGQFFVEDSINIQQKEGKTYITGSKIENTKKKYYKGLRAIWDNYNYILKKRTYNQQDSIELQKYFKEYKAYSYNFYKNHSNSYFTADVLMRSTIKGGERFEELELSKKELREMYSWLSSEIKKSSYGQTIKRFINLPDYPKVGERYSDFSLPNSKNEIVKLSNFEGKYLFVDFWASWCAPCRLQNPKLRRLYQKYKSKNFEIIGVSIDKRKDKWLDAIEKDQLSWTNVIDKEGRTGKICQQYGINGIPDNLLIDPKGIIIKRKIKAKDLEAVLEELYKY